MYGLCEKCYEMIDLSQHRNEWWDDYICCHCGETSFGLEIDEMILPAISELNKKGYFTQYCCSGHSLDGSPHRDTINNFYIFFKKKCEPSMPPEQSDIKIESDSDGTIYRKVFSSDLNYFRLFEMILDFNKEVYKWAKSLPERTI